MSETDSDDQRVAFLVVCHDETSTADVRRMTLLAHRDYVSAHSHLIEVSGPLIADDNVTRIGQMYILRVSTRADAEAFVARDPFTQAGIFTSIEISRLFPRFLQFSRI